MRISIVAIFIVYVGQNAVALRFPQTQPAKNLSGLAGFPKLQELIRRGSGEENSSSDIFENDRVRANSSGYTCVDGQVWVVVVDRKHHVPQHIRDNAPICVQELQVERSAFKFWKKKMEVTQKFFLDNPNVTFGIVTDTDVYVNPMSWSEIHTRYQQTVANSKARLVLATEQCCWFGTECTMSEAQEWLNTVRNSSKLPNSRFFLNSQYMGERAAILQLLGDALRTDPLDDQKAFSKIIVRTPDLIALDTEEKLFMSMSRGMTPSTGKTDLEGGPYTCNFGGNKTEECKCCEKPWGACRWENGSIIVTDYTVTETVWPKRPLLLHLNGAANFALPHGDDCPSVFEKAANFFVE